MQIVRFDKEVSIPVTRYGSNFRIGPLTGAGSKVRVQMMYLPPGGSIGRHPTSVRQMFAVVNGSAEVSGSDATARRIGVGYAAVWEPGEDHDARSESGVNAVCIEGEFETLSLQVTLDIEVSDYDPSWAGWFETLRERIWPVVAPVAVRIDHVGSTSVPGLAAKPIIDLDIVVSSEDEVGAVVSKLAAAGFRWRGDLGVPGRQSFARPEETDLPPHNLYLVVDGNKAHMDHILLRDRLLEDSELRERYASLKRRNVEIAGDDMDVYVAAKAAFVAQVLADARLRRGLPEAEYWLPDVGTVGDHGY